LGLANGVSAADLVLEGHAAGAGHPPYRNPHHPWFILEPRLQAAVTLNRLPGGVDAAHALGGLADHGFGQAFRPEGIGVIGFRQFPVLPPNLVIRIVGRGVEHSVRKGLGSEGM